MLLCGSCSRAKACGGGGRREGERKKTKRRSGGAHAAQSFLLCPCPSTRLIRGEGRHKSTEILTPSETLEPCRRRAPFAGLGADLSKSKSLALGLGPSLSPPFAACSINGLLDLCSQHSYSVTRTTSRRLRSAGRKKLARRWNEASKGQQKAQTSDHQGLPHLRDDP